MKLFTKLIFVAIFVTACTTILPSLRGPSSDSRVHEVPPGLTGTDLADFEHLSEGADMFPYEWIKALNSITFKDERGQSSKAFFSELEQRHGIFPSNNLKSRDGKTYMMPYVGFSTAWSNHPADQSDAFLEDEGAPVRTINGVKSIRMVGTNCSLCHSGGVEYRGEKYKIDGSPSMVNVRGYFIDLSRSTIAILAKKELMADFLKRLRVPNANKRAEELNDYFYHRLAEETNTVFDAGDLSAKLTLLLAKLGSTRRFFEGKQAIADTLTKLLKITYNFSESDDLGDLPKRMNYLGTLMVGTDPRTDETVSGYNRTDAFGRIGNLVLRNDDPISYTAPVSLPYIWGIKYMAMLHYNANSNSVMMRNVGQSLGLGSIILSKNLDSTTNVYNLNRMEHLVHKIKVPDWEKVFPQTMPEFRINQNYAREGQKIYTQHCAGCHESSSFVGPAHVLRDYKVFRLDKVGTDENAAHNAVKAVGSVRFEDSIFTGVGGIKARYYEKYNISKAEQDELEFKNIRGNEFFRDTLNGFTEAEQNKFGNNYGKIEAGMGYKARHLSGVWSTGPYLHNGSVPTIWDLLLPAQQRPKYFNVKSKEFDPVRLGFLYERKKDWKFSFACKKGDDECFDTTISGNHNTGHEYGTRLSQQEKMALIEYLKVLPPESEYSWY